MTAPTAMEQEIREQPEVLARRADQTRSQSRAVAELLHRPDVTHLVIAARGSSDNAARFGQYLLAEHCQVSTYLAAPSLFAAGPGPRLTGALVLGISQSGQSPDIVRVLQAAREQGRPTAAITNDPTSPLALAADACVPLAAGAERAVAATKTYTATLHALLEIALAAGASDLADGLARLPDALAAAIDRALDTTGPLVAGWAQPDRMRAGLTAVGRGTGLATACETALKIREVGRVRAEAYAVPDLLHGPIAGNTPGSAAWLLASPSFPRASWLAIADRLAREGIEVTAVTPDAGDAMPAGLTHRLPADLPAWAFDVVAVGIGQVAALRAGQAAGLDVDRPHGLQKVTLTR